MKAEIVVIGSGPGGAMTAHVLAEHGRDVLVLEEGPDLPLESCEPFSIQEMEQKYRAGGLNPMVGDAKIAFVEGRCVGGGSEINSGLYHRTPDEILEQWRSDFRLRETSAADLLPHFEYCERALCVGRPGPPPLASTKLEEGANRLGWRSLAASRCFTLDGQTDAGGQPRETRQSMTKTFLPRAVRAGARLMAGTRAHRLRQDGNGWSVTAAQNHRQIEIRADAVFVCGGAMQTPLLLRRSGIAKNVGNSLAIHPTVKAVALFDDPVNHAQLGVPYHQVREFAPRMSFGCSISSPPYLALAMADQRGCRRDVQSHWRYMAVYYAMITGPNTGRIRPVLGLPDPLIRYRLSPIDWRDLSTAIGRLCQLLLAAGARTVYPSLVGATAIHREDELSTLPSTLPPARSNLMTIHLFSSCPMGEDRTRCAADSMGQVHGTANLYINDASLIPTAPGVNPQGTVMALARRNTLAFLGKL